jgi:hypothetical protein
MKRSFTTMLALIGMVAPAFAKIVCPPGRYTLHPAGSRAAALEGFELVLGEGDAAIGGACAAVPARDFHPTIGQWANRVRARWSGCRWGRPLALRARFDTYSAYCARLEGVLRLGRGRRVRFSADRVPACGDGLRDKGEQCDGYTLFGIEIPCCTADCRVKPGCAARCDRHFPCEVGELCVYSCSNGGFCRPRAEVDCGGGPVCDCDQKTTYPDRCAAYEAGTGPAYSGPCRRY